MGADSHLTNDLFLNCIMKLPLYVAEYSIYRERNVGVFQVKRFSVEAVMKIIIAN